MNYSRDAAVNRLRLVADAAGVDEAEALREAERLQAYDYLYDCLATGMSPTRDGRCPLYGRAGAPPPPLACIARAASVDGP
jgi:hypothetical protein